MDSRKPLSEMKGVGPKSGALLEARGLYTAADLLRWYPREYDDCREPVYSFEAQPGTTAALMLMIVGNASSFRKGSRSVTHFQGADATGNVRLTFFNMPYLRTQLKPGTTHVFRGILKETPRGIRYMEQPRIYDLAEYAQIQGRLRPVYPQIAGVRRNLLQRLIETAAREADIPEFLPPGDAEELGLLGEAQAVRSIHLPEDPETLQKAMERLIFDEFFLFILGIRKEKSRFAQPVNERPMARCASTSRLIGALPYRLTDSQRKAWEQIEADLAGETVMYRLLQGDVGSGKTILAFLALLMCAENGRQGALMAPTEVLAVQHMESLTQLIREQDLPLHPVLLTGSVKGKARKEALARIADGSADVIIGTHALIQEAVQYRDLGLVITDEQHRFGVRQREALGEKSGSGQETPVLVMSATPIPRTLAIILYGELHVSLLTELPAGRLPIKNLAMDSSQRARAYRFLYRQVAEGRQVYVICPEIEEGEMEGLENVGDSAERLRKVMPEHVRIAELHGRMKPAEKNAVMDAFAAHETDILVSTTVVEVGINVPNASVILIENAERFGLSQLHQLRGRVGRGVWQAYCIFLYAGDEKPRRLEILEKTNDGFRIAEEDLKLRGPGDLFGVRQSGALGFRLADECEHAGILKRAAAYVDTLLARDPGYTCEALRAVDFRSI